jgi:hypothetical protein
MKLKQGQIWRTATCYVRIVQLDRLSVDFKMMEDTFTKDGTHKHLTKKEFCRLIKSATLVEEG